MCDEGSWFWDSTEACEQGNVCTVTASDDAACITGLFPADYYSSCENSVECQKGALCAMVSGLGSLCTPVCSDRAGGNIHSCPQNGNCISSGIANIPNFCLPEPQYCDAMAQTGCPTGKACYFNGSETFCLNPGTLSAGEDCNGINNICAPGLQCNTDGDFTCHKLCALTSDCGDPMKHCDLSQTSSNNSYCNGSTCGICVLSNK